MRIHRSFFLHCVASCFLLLAICLAGCQVIAGDPPAQHLKATATATHTALPASPTPTRLSNASSGCGRSPLAKGGVTIPQAIVSQGSLRNFSLHIPTGYTPTHPTPLVIVLHGHDGNPQNIEEYTQFSPLADAKDVLVAYPQGVIGPDKQSGWNTFGPATYENRSVNDVAFIGDVITQLEQSMCVDETRVYAAGFSNGGGLIGVLACQLAGRIAAFAAVSGQFFPIPGGCHPARPLAIMEFHGTSDTMVPYNGTAQTASIPAWVRGWELRDRCVGNPVTFFDEADVIGQEWTNCARGAVVIHYRIQDGGHTWPGSPLSSKDGRTTHTISATPLIWEFFSEHHL